MFTKGFSLTETLLALLLSCLILISALSCQWFARRSMQVALEQLAASHLLIDISQQINTLPMSSGQRLSALLAACPTCSSKNLQQLQNLSQLIHQATSTVLAEPELCVASTTGGMRLVLSWRSAVSNVAGVPVSCGSGNNRRQVMLETGQ